MGPSAGPVSSNPLRPCCQRFPRQPKNVRRRITRPFRNNLVAQDLAKERSKISPKTVQERPKSSIRATHERPKSGPKTAQERPYEAVRLGISHSTPDSISTSMPRDFRICAARISVARLRSSRCLTLLASIRWHRSHFFVLYDPNASPLRSSPPRRPTWNHY